ncbi:hypothetical protein A2U01_0107274, partial [Trifolium medium]|nr:hypothetical protein [Trifolium medium]
MLLPTNDAHWCSGTGRTTGGARTPTTIGSESSAVNSQQHMPTSRPIIAKETKPSPTARP